MFYGRYLICLCILVAGVFCIPHDLFEIKATSDLSESNFQVVIGYSRRFHSTLNAPMDEQINEAKENLEGQINALLHQGYELNGGTTVTIHDGHLQQSVEIVFVQTMIRHK